MTDLALRTPFFLETEQGFEPTRACAGYWEGGTISGRPVGGLLGFVLERAFGHEDTVPTRFCVDLLRPPPRRLLTPRVRLVKDGGRTRLAAVDLYAGEDLVAQASCQFVRRTADPALPTRQSPGWTAPSPDSLASDGDGRHWELRPVPSGAGFDRSAWTLVDHAADARGNPAVLGALSPIAARQAWARETRLLVGGEALTPFVRVALAADFASPLANSGDSSIDFVNSDFTVHLYRTPVSEWVGFDLVKHHARDGIALGECWLHDEQGAIGSVTVTAVAQRQKNH